jgi:glycosyltransferase involved in cell wall biosynthesis
MSVSVVTVCLNSEKTIGKAIKSILAQGHKNIEYIVIDGNSEDGTMAVVEGFRSKLEELGIRLVTVSEKDSGIFDAMNKGVRLATGKLVGILNSDDWYEPDTVGKVAEEYARDPFDVIYGSIRCVRLDGKAFIKRSKGGRYVTTRHWNHPSMFVTRKVYEHYRYPIESLYDDVDMYLWLKRSRLRVRVVDDVLSNYSLAGMSNQRNASHVLKRVKEKYRIYRKYGYSRLYIFELILTEAGKLVLYK